MSPQESSVYYEISKWLLVGLFFLIIFLILRKCTKSAENSLDWELPAGGVIYQGEDPVMPAPNPGDLIVDGNGNTAVVKTPAPIKTSICFNTEQFKRVKELFGDDLRVTHLDGLAYTLEDRATCEKDTSLVHPIPYINIITGYEKNGTPRLLTYLRGGKGGESKLHGKIATGVGGHVDELPADGETLLDLFTREAKREVKEEIGIDIDKIMDPSAFRDMIEAAPIYYSDIDEVGRYHFAVMIFIDIDGKGINVESMEEGVIENVETLSAAFLTSAFGPDDIENWALESARAAIDNYSK